MKRKSVTIKDVAAEAGVSRQTVSRVLNDKGEVAADTRERILQIMDELGYYPNPAARGLSGQRTYNIGLIIPYSAAYLFSDPHLLQFFCGVDQIAGQRGFNLLFSTSRTDNVAESAADISAYERLLRSGYVDGIIVVETIASEKGRALLERYGYPWVTLGYGLNGKERYAVHADDRGGARQAMMHLLSLGHRRIGVIGGPQQGLVATEERLSGCRQALADHNLTLDETLLIWGDYTSESGYRAAAQLLDAPNPPTAIFALSDRMAIGVLRCLRERRISVPGAFSVVGFDDIPLAAEFTPTLTTVRQPALEMGQQAARLLLDVVEGYNITLDPISLPTELVVRDSTGPVLTGSEDC